MVGARYYYDNVTDIDCKFWTLDKNSTSTVKPGIRTCEHWIFDRSVMSSTIVTDFELVCSKTWMSYMSQSFFMAGVLVGNIAIGLTSDRFGRRSAFLVSSIGSLTFGVASAFSNSFVMFSVLRCLTGIFVYCMFPVLFTLVSELVVARHRAALAQFAEAGFAVGLMILPLLAFCVKDWRKLQLSISVPIAVSIIVWWVLPESPRWLILNDKRKKAVDVIGNVRKVNNLATGCKPDRGNDAEGIEELKTFSLKISKSTEVIATSSKTYGILDIVRTKNLRRISFVQFYQWFAVSCVYYGLTLNAAELGGDPFINCFLIGLSEIVGVFLVIPMVEKAGRVPCSSISEILAGVFCILMSYIPKDITWLYIGSSLLGKFAITCSFSVMYIHTSELFPTPVRSVASGICNAWARLGGLVSPLIAMLGLQMTNLPYIVFGILSMISGIATLLVPETSKQALQSTIEGGEQFLSSNPGVLIKMWDKFIPSKEQQPKNESAS